MKLFTKKEVAKKLRCHKKTVENYIKAGKLDCKRIGGSEKKAGKILISEKDLNEFLDQS